MKFTLARSLQIPDRAITCALAAFALAGLTLQSHAQSENGNQFEFTDPALTPFAPSASQEVPLNSGNFNEFVIDARLVADGEPIPNGLVWRVFDTKPGADGTMPLVASAEGGTGRFQLPAGDYLVHAAFGRASIARLINVPKEGGKESFVIEAGGLQLNASLAGQPLESRDLLFEIYDDELDDRGERTLIAKNIAAGQTIRLNKGTYHIVSLYGDINATVRADLRVQAGKLTKASMEHRGAKIEVKLVTQSGSEAIADTAWSVQTESGEEVFQSVRAQPNFILAEGIYVVIAQNDGKVTPKEFSVKAGEDALIELIAQ